MKKLALLLLLVAGGAKAQSTAPPCMPLLYGKTTTTLPTYVSGVVGDHMYWKCSYTDAKKKLVVGTFGPSCPKSLCSPLVFSEALATITNSTAKVTTAKTVYQRFVTRNCDATARAETSAFGDLCRERLALTPTGF